MPLLSFGASRLGSVLGRYAANRVAPRVPQYRENLRTNLNNMGNPLQSPIVRTATRAATNVLGAVNPIVGGTIRAAQGAGAVYKGVNNVREANYLNNYQTAQQMNAARLPVSGTRTTASIPTSPSTANTATGSMAPATYSAASSSTGGTAPYNPYADYLAQEQQLLWSGQGQQAIQNSRNLTGANTPTQTSTPSIPSPASAGAVSSQFSPESLKSIAQANLERLQQQYLGTLTPSQREQELQNQLTNLQGATALGVSGLEGQGRLIPLNLVRGQQSQLQEQGNIQAQTLQGQIANEIANRQAQGQVYGAQLGFESERLQSEQQQAQQAQQLELSMLSAGYRPVDPSQVSDPSQVVQIGGRSYIAPTPESKLYEVGGNLVDQNGQVVYQGPTAGGDPYTLSPGQVRYDANGNVISAVPGGGSDGFSLSPGQIRYDAYGNVIASAPGGGAANATEGERASAGFYNRALAAEKTLQTLGGDVNNKFLQGFLPNELQSSAYQQFRQAGEDFIKAVLRAESGASIPPEEMNSYFKTYFPAPGDSAATIAQKAASRQRQIEALQIEAGRALGGGAQDDPLGLGFNEVGADTNQGSAAIQKIAQYYPVGSVGKQCGRFVNRIAGIRMGDSFKSKMAYTNPSIKIPQPGDFFVMPYSWTGHTGFVKSRVFNPDGSLKGIYALDSNYRLDERVGIHFIPASRISGYGRTPLATTKVSLG